MNKQYIFDVKKLKEFEKYVIDNFSAIYSCVPSFLKSKKPVKKLDRKNIQEIEDYCTTNGKLDSEQFISMIQDLVADSSPTEKLGTEEEIRGILLEESSFENVILLNGTTVGYRVIGHTGFNGMVEKLSALSKPSGEVESPLMPPKKEYEITMKVESIEKGKPSCEVSDVHSNYTKWENEYHNKRGNE